MQFSPAVTYSPINEIDSPVLHLASPFTGKVRQLDSHPEPLFANGMLGLGICVELSNGKLTAPLGGRVEQVKRHGTEIIMTAKNGLKLLINITLPAGVSDAVIQVSSAFGKAEIEQGELLAYFDFPSNENQLIGSLIIVNAQRLGPCFYPLKQVRAGLDPLITVTKNQKI